MTRTRWYWIAGIGAGALLIGGLLFLLLADGDDDDDGDGETPTPDETETETTDATDSPTDEPTSAPDNTPSSGAAFDGTTDVTEEGTASSVIYFLEEVRVGEQEGYDRIVFEFSEPEEGAGPLPSYRIEYVVPPMSGCASGIDADIEGVGMLSIKMRTAQAHNNEGQPTIDEDEITADFTTIVEAEQTCDFEGLVEWGVGTTAVKGYRVLELDGPPRLVVDILH